ncbi:MAG: hypothetical protein HPY74_06060 [Firmicutes bacterium]|nr:hypothetical protein [Bacillota bacterium]
MKNGLLFPIKCELQQKKKGKEAGNINVKVTVEAWLDNGEILPATDHEIACIGNTIIDMVDKLKELFRY